MTSSWLRWCCKLGLVSALTIGGAIATSKNCARAQIVPDSTLGTESSVVTLEAGDPTVEVISGGATRGTNLFHSFEQFSVQGGTAFFNNAASIKNIISRVTGKSISNIDGLLRANGTTNLFLINPNGIIFGPNAKLSIGGSFLASTASSLNFADRSQFSATAPQTTPLLSVNVPLGLQFGGAARGINVNGSGLVVPGKTLALVGGDITLAGGDLAISGGYNLQASGGRIELGSVAENSLVKMTSTNTGWNLGYEGIQNFKDIQLSQEAKVNAPTFEEGSGNIQVQGRRVTIQGGAAIATPTLGSKPGGTLTVRASDSVELSGTIDSNPSSLSTNADPLGEGATGNGGNLTIETRRLLIQNGAQVNTSTFGAGSAGNLTVIALDSVKLVGVGTSPSSPSGLTPSLLDASGVTGNGGNLTIKTGRLLIQDGAVVSTTTYGVGSAGNLTVIAPDSVELVGTSPDGLSPSFLAASGATGNGGNLTIETGRLLIQDGAVVSTFTYGVGTAGNLTVIAPDSVELLGTSPNGSLFSSLTASGATGNGGNLTIETGRLLLQNGAQVNTSTYGAGTAGNLTVIASDSVELVGTSPNGYFSSILAARGATGNGGNLSIQTGRLLLQDGAQVNTSTSGAGTAGNLTIIASDSVELVGRSPNDQFASGLFAQVEQGATGNGGNLSIQTGQLTVLGGAQVSTTARTGGKAGKLTINAKDSILLSGSAPTDTRDKGGSGVFVSADEGATRDAGELTITTEQLTVEKGAKISADNYGTGQGGNATLNVRQLIIQNGGLVGAGSFGEGGAGTLTVNATDSVEVSGTGTIGSQPVDSTLFTEAQESGNAGNLNITTESLNVRDRADVTVSSTGAGDAGNLEVVADSIRLENQALLTSNTRAGQGNINLESQDLVLVGDSNITTNATGRSVGGNITINTDILAALEDSDISANAEEARGGQVIIDAQSIFGTEFRVTDNPATSDITASSELGPQFSGTVEINTPDVDPNQGLVNLPTQPIESEVVQACTPGGSAQQSEFIITGRGGLPPNPTDFLNTEAVWIDLDLTTQQVENRPRFEEATQPTNSTAQPLVEATGWALNDKGEVVLIASAPTATPDSPGLTPANCH